MRALVVALAVLAFQAAWAAGGKSALVKDGRAAGAIVLAKKPSAGERFAAEELRRYVEKATGAELPIVQEPTDRRGVYIGSTALAASLGLPRGELGTDGFSAVVADGKLVLVGRNQLATRYGVYTLLREAVGVRWFLPTELFEHVPKRRDVVARPSRWRTVPAFDPRTYFGIWLDHKFSYVGLKDPQFGCDIWATRNRLTVDRRGLSGQFSHNLYRIVVPSRYAKVHPEYFPVREDGRRYLPRDDRDQSWQPCFSQEGVVRLAVAAARKAFDADPKRRFFSLGINDGWGCCCCPACRKLDSPRRTFRRRVVHSASYFTFVNRVAREVAKTHPGRYLGCIAYNEVELPPPFPLEPNVWVYNTQDTSQHHDRAYRDADREMLRGWHKVCRNLGKYDYYGLTWVLPRYFPGEIEADLRFARRLGVRSYFIEDVPTWPTMGPLCYIGAQLLWDPAAGWRRLQSEFCRGLFGRAAGTMERYFDTWEQVWHTQRKGQWFEGLGRVRQQVPLYPPAVIARCDRLLEEAMEKAESDRVRRRVALFRRGWEWARLYAIEDHLCQKLAGRLRTEADADAAVRTLGELQRATARRLELYNRLDPKSLAGGLIHWMLEFHKRDQAWRPRIAAARTTASAAITQWYARTLGTGKDAAAAWQALALRCPGTEMSDFATAMAYLCAHAGELKNLLVNPGFEHTATGAAAQGRADWDPRKAPPGWSTWAEEPKAARFLWQNSEAAQGKRCVQLAGCRRDACYIQVIPARPGERYLVRAMARTTSSKSAGTLVRIRWQDAQRGWVVPGRDVFLPLSAGHSGQWEGVFGVATVPPEAGRLVVILAASGHENARDASWFDDVFVCRLPE